MSDIGETVADTDLETITMSSVFDDYQMFIIEINTREKIPKFKDLTGILMQDEERRLILKPQSVDLVLMAKKNFFKGKGNPQQKNGGKSQKIPNQTQGMHPNRINFEIK